MRNDTLAEMNMSRAENIYNIADNHARTVQVCIDRLHELGAEEQLKVLTERLQKLAIRATAKDHRNRIRK
jgi:ribosomal protein S15P/S13E